MNVYTEDNEKKLHKHERQAKNCALSEKKRRKNIIILIKKIKRFGVLDAWLLSFRCALCNDCFESGQDLYLTSTFTSLVF